MRKTNLRKLLTFLMLTLIVVFSMGVIASAQETMLAKVKTTGARSANVSWQKVDGADKYVVYHTRCKTPFKEKGKKTVAGSQSSVVFRNLNNKRLNKFKVQAYSGSKLLAESLVIHVAFPSNPRCTNPRAIKAGPSSATLAVGGTLKISGSCTKVNTGKSLIHHDKELRFFSTDPSVATVAKDGTVKAVKAGTCQIYTVAINGIWKKTKITVTAAAEAAPQPAKEEEVYVLSYAWKFEGGRPAEDPALPAPQKLKAGAAVTLAKAPSLDGYTFQGWDFTDKTMPAKDTVVTGKWLKDKKYTVTYVLLNGPNEGRNALRDAYVIGQKTDTYDAGEAVPLKELLLKYNPYTDFEGDPELGSDLSYLTAYNRRFWYDNYYIEDLLYDDPYSVAWRWLPMPSSKWAGDYAAGFPDLGMVDEESGDYVPNENNWVFESVESMGEEEGWPLPIALKINQNYVFYEMLYQEQLT